MNALLTAGGSLAHTISLCRIIDSKVIQVDSTEALVRELEREAHTKDASLSKHHLHAHTEVDWVTDADRDGLFDFLSSRDCVLFTANVKLNNRALNAMLVQGGSLEGTLSVMRGMQEKSEAFATVDDLIHCMKENAAKAEPLPTPPPPRAPRRTAQGGPPPTPPRGLPSPADPLHLPPRLPPPPRRIQSLGDCEGP